MDGKQLRQNFSYGFLAIYILYGMVGIGMTGLLFSFAIGLIIVSFNYPLELTVAATILSGITWKLLASRTMREGFESTPRSLKGASDRVPVGKGEDLQGIAKRVEEIAQKNVFQPSGVLSSSFAECFADMNSSNQPSNAGSATTPATAPATTASAPAPTNAPTTTANMEKDLPASNSAAAATPNPQTTEKPTATQEPQPKVESGFTDPSTSGMFKLGSIPADVVGGSHIDIGTTMMNALNSLKPDQIKAMTDDTRKLMETQKSLMGMLTTMKPMISDGRQLMETFTEMFAKN
jgi:hypothetical protein